MDQGVVFATGLGGYLNRHNFNRDFKKLTVDAGLGPLPPYTMRHTAFTLLSLGQRCPPS